jgi:hypothetical protein
MLFSQSTRGRTPEDDAKWWVGVGLDQDGFLVRNVSKSVGNYMPIDILLVMWNVEPFEKRLITGFKTEGHHVYQG